jgi:hypothetical protein
MVLSSGEGSKCVLEVGLGLGLIITAKWIRRLGCFWCFVLNSITGSIVRGRGYVLDFRLVKLVARESTRNTGRAVRSFQVTGNRGG